MSEIKTILAYKQKNVLQIQTFLGQCYASEASAGTFFIPQPVMAQTIATIGLSMQKNVNGR